MLRASSAGVTASAPNTWSAKQTFGPIANDNAVAISNTLSGSNTSAALTIAATWNTSGIARGIELSIIDTASNAQSILINAIVGGVSLFAVNKAGTAFAQNFLTQSGGALSFAAQSKIMGQTDGIITLFNNAATDFSQLQFGGTTSSFPSLKRSAALLQARLADDSNFAVLQGSLRCAANATTGLVAGVLSALTNASIVIQDASGQAYRVPVIV